MSIRNKDKKNFVKVGLFVTALTSILMILIVSIGKENSFFDSKITLRARVENVSNLKEGSYVELKGIRIGTVSSIDIYSADQVEIIMKILKDKLKWVKKDSRVAISTAGLVGDKFIEIIAGPANAENFDPEKDILYSSNQMDFKTVISKSESIADLTERILAKIDNMLQNMNDGRSVTEAVHALNRSAKNLEKITSDIKKANLAHLAQNMNSSSERIYRLGHSMEKIVNRIEKGPGTLNSLIYDDGLHDDLRALLGGAQRNKIIKYFIRQSIKKSEEARE